MSRISISDRLVIHKYTCETFKLISDCATSRTHSRGAGHPEDLGESIDDEIVCTLSWKYTLQAFHERIHAGLTGATIVLRKDGKANFVRLFAELDKNGRQEVADILLSMIPEIKVKKGACSQPQFTQVTNFLDDRRADR